MGESPAEPVTYAPDTGPSDTAVPLTASRPTDLALRLIAASLVVLGLIVLAIRWNLPLLGMHSFRQTETAITSYWLLRGGPWFAYQTPVMGAPWAIPYEFPIYQLLSAGLVKLIGIPLDPAGRLLSYLFLCLTILPASVVGRAYGMSRKGVLVFAVLLLASPIYLYWGTAFLIETLAVFLSFAFLAETERAMRSSGYSAALLGATIAGILGALCKITTFVPFYFLAGLLLLCALFKRLQRRESPWRIIVSGSVIMLPSPILFWLWNRFADAQKMRNPIGRYVVSSTPLMHQWNFGTWGQLFSREMLLTLLRSTTDTLGMLSLLIVGLLVLVIFYYRALDIRSTAVILCALAGFFLPFVIFTNLHIIHNYYDAANAIFLIGAVAVVIDRCFSTGHYRIAWYCLLLTIVSQLSWFRFHFLPDILHPPNRWLLTIARVVERNTNPDGVVVIYGQEWSPVIPYYAQRRALMEPTFVPAAEVDAGLPLLMAPQGGYPVEAIVRCPSPMDRNVEFVRYFETLDATLPRQHLGACDVYLIRDSGTRKNRLSGR
jgi:hypothetical protein